MPMPTASLTARYSQLTTAADKGKALEAFCEEFFAAIPGVVVTERRVLDDAHSQEVDLVLDNYQDDDGLPELAPLLFVEAKNWTSPVGSAEVAWFDWKIRLAGLSQGILVVANGVTGRPDDRTSAWRILGQANLEGRRLIVLSPDEMVACITTSDVRDLIRAKVRGLAVHRAPL